MRGLIFLSDFFKKHAPLSTPQLQLFRPRNRLYRLAAQAERLLKDLGSARSGFSFETVLQYRFKAARDYVQAQLRGERAGGHSGGAEPPANVDAGGGSGEVGPSPAEANATTEREAEAEAEAERGLVGKKAELAGDEQQHGTAAAAAAHADS